MNDYGVKIGTVLWQMRGHHKEREDPVKWHAVPHCVEFVDGHKFLDAYGCGGSLNGIGKNWFRTREECLEDFEKHRESYSQPAATSAALHQEERLGSAVSDSVAFWRDDGILRVFVNGRRLNNGELPWRIAPEGAEGEPWERVTLGEIREALGTRPIITVWHENWLWGKIYETGNHPEETVWRLHGRTMGFA